MESDFYNNYIPNEKIRPNQIIDEEVLWDKNKTIVSTTDKRGVIIYANQVFINACEYSKMELLGEHHSIIRHPDMPKVAFKVLWEALGKGNNFHAIVKNLTKSGRYYWVITNFTINKSNDGEITGYTAKRKSVPKSVVSIVEPLYRTVLEIEKLKGEEVAELYFKSFLEEEVGKTYDEFVFDLFEKERKKAEKKQSSFFTRFNPLKKSLSWFFGD